MLSSPALHFRSRSLIGKFTRTARTVAITIAATAQTIVELQRTCISDPMIAGQTSVEPTLISEAAFPANLIRTLQYFWPVAGTFLASGRIGSAEGATTKILHVFDFGGGDPTAVGRDTWIEVIAGTFTDFPGEPTASRDRKNLHVISLLAAVIQRFSIRGPVDSSVGFRSVRKDFFEACSILGNDPKDAFGGTDRIFECDLVARRRPDGNFRASNLLGRREVPLLNRLAGRGIYRRDTNLVNTRFPIAIPRGVN